MSEPLDDLESAALRLPSEARARLAERLLSSLEPETEQDVEALWLAEAERRLAELEKGEVEATDADQVVAELRSRFR